MPLFGIDVSDFQGTVDWAKVKASGITFGIAKATEGNGYLSKTIAANLAGMRANGLVPGAYHFLISGAYVSGAAQADYFLSHVGDPTGLIVALDVETEGNLAKQPGITEVTDFVNRIHAKYPDHQVLIYSGAWYWVGHMGNPPGHLLGPNWNSRYVSASGSPSTIYKYVPATWWQPGYGGWLGSFVLQFTSHATVPGVSGTVDCSAFYGTELQLRALAGALALPSTSTPTEDSMTIVTLDKTGFPRVATFAGGTVVGYAPDGSTVKGTFTAGSTATCGGVASITQDPQKAPNGSGFRLITDGPLAGHYVLRDTCTLPPPPPAPTTDCTAEITAAVAPLKTEITALTTGISKARTALDAAKAALA
jgi:GH25 family lysozyme M1 (1,4-beta-N-acetylmuramidase)